MLEQLVDETSHAVVVGLPIEGQIDDLLMDGGQLFREVFEQQSWPILHLFAQYFLQIMVIFPREFPIEHFGPAIDHALEIVSSR